MSTAGVRVPGQENGRDVHVLPPVVPGVAHAARRRRFPQVPLRPQVIQATLTPCYIDVRGQTIFS